MPDQDTRLPIRNVHVRAVTPDDDDLILRATGVNGSTDTTVWAQDISLHDESGNSYSATNPLPVAVQEDEGTEVCDYQTTASVAKNVVVNHDYTITALKAFKGIRIWASASGRIKIECQKETAPASASYTTFAVGFNSTATPNIDLPLDKVCSNQVAGAKIRVKITNKDNETQDVYSTLAGIEV